MSSSTREEIAEVYAALRDSVSRVLELSYDVLTTPERLTYLAKQEDEWRRLPAARHELINQLVEQSSEEELGGRLPHALASRLRITRAEASRRIGEAADLGQRRALTGEVLAPQLTATAAGQRDGRIGGEHVRVIRDFFKRLPAHVDVETEEKAEAHLARLAGQYRPDQLAKLAERLMDCLHPDGDYTEDDRARRRGVSLGKQDVDGMSRLSGYLTPEARATLEAVLAKLGAPGMCNPFDETPCVQGTPSEDAIRHDMRSAAQRNHDGLVAACRALLASGDLGQHNGLPASIIVTTTLKDLEAAAGKGLTGGGTLLPMSDVIRLSRHAHQYLAIFDHGGEALALYHTKRLASPGQRIVLYAKDRGCTSPGCDVHGYYCEVHHVIPYAQCQTTDVNQLTLACGGHHPLAERGYITRKNSRGDTEWIPPAHLEHGQPRTNSYHHPEKLLCDGDDEPL
ncbi:HNH endonuclease signature motif containing protein [Mycobacterium kubicae]|uniref:HNH endonuclease n=1 Tax=Mycobacterium kubicae TaxID=120959 RepID=A0AAX1JF76_9MYCO|nr:HNH endonuclease signature motif containing protein [Mycobacterium kubicae]MCV7096720.1 HNH endonuclease [Mycobacterium kubicae]ORW01604.1 hypothetical protein AWC13_07425 [Mycobacterium kubicae]QNI10849.1 HNH endonuclease [Mycobacterium kubicae]QPI39057.1 HNH endonuclease [Mycobacterium kubicae]